MKLEIPEGIVTKVKPKCSSHVLKESRDWGSLQVDHTDLEQSDLPLLVEAAAKFDTPAARRLVRKINQLSKLGNGKAHHNLELLADEMRAVVQKLPHRWIFKENDLAANTCDPYLVTSIEFIPAESRSDYYIPAHIRVGAKAICRGEEVSLTRSIHRENMNGNDFTAEGMFPLAEWVLETPELVEEYQNSCNRYSRIRQKEGLQLTVRGLAEAESDSGRYWDVKRVRLDRDGVVGRAVLDDGEKWGEDKNTVVLRDSIKRAKSEDEEEHAEATLLPEHPYVRVFDMRTHTYCVTHVDNTREYLYDRTIFDRIVIPADHKELIDALVTSDRSGDDLVAGKGKGVVILSSGSPGTGKTITAEAYSERSHKPLYSVQCSQLGLDPESLEKELGIVLNRAMRWGAILLLDEADVYIRARGDDINQNAVVGVFLRLLEYYTGVLFMTTNRSTMVDDAILSRCVVHIRYKVPEKEDAKKVWKLMFELFCQAKLTDSLAVQLLTEFPTVSPRTVKQLCRLAKTMSVRLSKPLDLSMFKWIARFQDMEESRS